MHLRDRIPKFPRQGVSGKAQYEAIHNSGKRSIAAITNIVIHSTEGETAEGAASWFANPASAGSAHMVLSDDVCFITLPETLVPWAAPPWNTRGYHVEIAGFAAWTAKEWEAHEKRIINAAEKVAYRCHRYQVNPIWLDEFQVHREDHGITSHRIIDEVFHQSTHTDPGPNFPVPMFMEAVDWYFHNGNK